MTGQYCLIGAWINGLSPHDWVHVATFISFVDPSDSVYKSVIIVLSSVA